MQSTLNSTYLKLALATVCAVSMGLTACQNLLKKQKVQPRANPLPVPAQAKKFVLPLKARTNHLTTPMPMAR